MNDIGKELYGRVRADFERRLAAEKHPPKDMRGVSDYSARVGRYLAEAIAANVTEDALPDGRLYYNIAESILTPTLRTNYELVNDTAAEVQRLLDERQGLHIKPARADYPEERVHTVIGAASEEGIEFDRALRRMTSPAENITQSFADDFMQANAEQRSRAGFDTFIERQGGAKCCLWCAGLVGVFAYPKEVPKDVYARHDNCTCSVTYGTKGGARQNVWTKAKWNVPPVQEPHRMTAEEAAEKGAFAEPRRLTGGANGGIINYAKAIDSMFYSDDYEHQTYTKEEIIEHLKTSPVGLATIRYLEENPRVKVKLSEDREVTDRGRHEKDLLTIWLNNCPNVRVAAQTVVHEVTHHKYGIGGSQLAETICFAFEKMHKEGRDYVTQEEWDTLADLVRNAYRNYPAKGGVGDIERFKKIIKEG